ncbi:MAG: DUF418 domain-containing protein [Alphaproteobacteria bacterium]|nr:DUF418 domain-containing protein [Alphaproteobacteria bacterium]MBU0792597.1 DUF418 domain-containing protein [Alphaproteobacteria bacterium]MBU0876741.1 DUF418 domain-containing protein [Alphaproteobacteria bacterium]MBU1768987.1 DUF418 domain-containing protein [Alphaproteobacteria bacterium]
MTVQDTHDTTSASVQRAAGVAPARDRSVDALRGFALLGVILVNVPFFAYPIGALGGVERPVDLWAFGALMTLAIGKFFLIFSFLFGFGFATSIASDQAKGRRSGPRFARRLTGLFVFGALHAVFFFIGDILMLYALLGVLLWFARNFAPRTLLVLAVLAYLLAVFAQAAAFTATGTDPEGTARAAAAYLGGFLDAADFRLREDIWLGQPFILIFNGPAALAMFLAGLALAKMRLFPGVRGRRARWRLGWTLLLIGLGASAASLAWVGPLYVAPPGGPSGAEFFAAMARSAAAPLLSAGYGLLLLAAADRTPESVWVRILAIAGQMTLTGYLLHSVILAFVFGGWGLGWYAQVSAATCIAVGLGVYLSLVTVFAVWKRRFRYGPDEWLLRSWVDLRAARM